LSTIIFEIFRLFLPASLFTAKAKTCRQVPFLLFVTESLNLIPLRRNNGNRLHLLRWRLLTYQQIPAYPSDKSVYRYTVTLCKYKEYIRPLKIWGYNKLCSKSNILLLQIAFWGNAALYSFLARQ